VKLVLFDFFAMKEVIFSKISAVYFALRSKCANLEDALPELSLSSCIVSRESIFSRGSFSVKYFNNLIKGDVRL
jgi:hypothetical protein